MEWEKIHTHVKRKCEDDEEIEFWPHTHTETIR